MEERKNPRGTNPVVLLDLNYTLVGNSADVRKRFPFGRNGVREWVPHERYRAWLVELLREIDCFVILLTARSSTHRDITMEALKASPDLGGWLPDRAYFNTTNERPPASKQGNLERLIFPIFGMPEERRYVGLESNASTRAMYRRLGITCTPVYPEHDEHEKAREIRELIVLGDRTR